MTKANLTLAGDTPKGRRKTEYPMQVDPQSWTGLQLWAATEALRIAQHYGVTVPDILGIRKKGRITTARMWLIYSLRTSWVQTTHRAGRLFALRGQEKGDALDWQPLSYPVIAALLRKDHTGVMYLYKRAAKLHEQAQTTTTEGTTST